MILNHFERKGVKNMKFITWVLKQTNQNSAIGDVARDFRDDRKRPHANSNIDKIKQYLISCNACSGAMDAFDMAVIEYEKRKKRGFKPLI